MEFVAAEVTLTYFFATENEGTVLASYNSERYILQMIWPATLSSSVEPLENKVEEVAYIPQGKHLNYLTTSSLITKS